MIIDKEMDSKNYLYFIGIIIVLLFLSYPSQVPLFRPNPITLDDPVSVKNSSVDVSAAIALTTGTDTLVIGNKNGIKLEQGKQAIDVGTSDIILYAGSSQNTERMRILGSNGFVGIGKTNPTSALDINGLLTVDNFAIRNNYSVLGNYGIGTTSPLTPLHVVGTTTTTTLLVGDKIGVGTNNPLSPLHVAGTTLTTKISVGTTSSTTNLDVYESMHYVGKEFKVGGTPDTYYPVIVDAEMSYISGKYEFGICRGYVHLDQDWHGVMNFYVEGKPYYCGHEGHYLKWRMCQRTTGPAKYRRFVAGLGDATCAPEIVVWMLGGTTYYFTGHGCKLKNGNSSGINVSTADGVVKAIRTTIEPYLDSDVCSGDNLTNMYTFGSNIGIGVSNPLQGKLQVAGRSVLGYIPQAKGGILIDNEDAYGGFPCIQSITNTLGVNNILLNPNGGGVSIGTNLSRSKFYVYDQTSSGWAGLGFFGNDTTGVVLGTFNNIAYIGGHNGPLNQWTNVCICAGGNLGVGRVDPLRKLDVNGYARICADSQLPGFNNTGSALYPGEILLGGGYGPVIRSVYPNSTYTDSLSLQFCTTASANNSALATRVHIQAISGYVGIGKDNPASHLDVNGTIRSNTQVAVVNGAEWDHIRMWHSGSTGFIDAGGAETGIAFRINTNANVFPASSYTEVMRLMPDGNGATLYGGLTMTRPVATESDYGLMIKFHNNYAPGYYDWAIGPEIVSGSAAFCIRGGSTDDNVNTMTNLITISVDGYVGIGMGNAGYPQYPLHILGTPSRYCSGGAIRALYWFGDYRADNTCLTQISIATNQSIQADALYISSDKRIKTNLIPIQYGLKSIRLLKPIHYNHIDVLGQGTSTRLGFIAQEVKEVVPELVNLISDFICDAYDFFSIIEQTTGKVTVSLHKPLDWKVGTIIKAIIRENEENKEKILSKATVISISGNICILNLGEEVDAYGDQIFLHGKMVDDFHTVDYEKLTPILTKAVQEVADQIDNLQTEVTYLRSKLEYKETENVQLTASLSSLLQWARLNGFSG